MPRLSACMLAVVAAVTFPLTLAHAQQHEAPLSPGPGEGLFLIVTDIHFNPFADPALVPRLDQSPVSEWGAIFRSGTDAIQGYGKDAGHALTVSALEAAAASGMAYDYVLYTGDYLGHDFNATYRSSAGPSPQGLTSFAVKTARFVSLLLEQSFADTPILGVMGNTDAACGDYEIAPDSAFIAGLADQWAALSRQPDRFAGFKTGGYYKVAHPTVADQDIIVLNNIFWTPRYSDRCNAAGGDPGADMMTWLENQIAATRAAGRTAQILLHVPPGINAYSTTGGTGTCAAKISPFWRDPFPEDFVELLRKHPGTVKYTFSGHTHMDSFAILDDSSGKPMVASQITPAVSPIFGNNPAFAVFLYDRSSGDVLDAATFYLSNLDDAVQGTEPDWQLEYRYRDTYGIKDLSAQSRASVAEAIKSDDTTRQRFSALYAVSAANGPIDGSDWTAYACAQSATSKAAYQACYCGGN